GGNGGCDCAGARERLGGCDFRGGAGELDVAGGGALNLEVVGEFAGADLADDRHEDGFGPDGVGLVDSRDDDHVQEAFAVFGVHAGDGGDIAEAKVLAVIGANLRFD